MAIIAQDTFIRSNIAANSNVALGWGTSSDGHTWATTSGSGSYAITSNEGTLTNCTAITFEQLGTGTIADCEVLARVAVNSTNYNMIGVTLRQTASNTAYRVRINSSNSAQGFSLARTVAGSGTVLASATFTPTLSTFYWIRGRVVGSSLFGKVWQDGTSEPAAWTLTATDTTIVGAGGYGLCCQSTVAANTAQFDHISVDNLSSTIKDNLAVRMRVLSATLQDLGVRLKLQPNGVRSLSTRLVLRRPNVLYDVGTRLNLKPQVVSAQDASVYKTQLVKAYTSAGVFIDVVRDAPLLTGFKEAVNTAISPIEVVLPRAFDNFDVGGAGGPGTIAQGNIWKYFLFGPGLPVTGKLRYQGVVDAFAPSIADNGAETVTVTLVPQSSSLVDHGIGGQQLFTATDPVTIFNWWFNNNDPITGHPYAYPLTLDGTNLASSGVSVTYPFLNMTLADVFAVLVLTFPPNWFFRCNPDLSTTLNIAPVTAQHNFMLGQHCAVPQYKQDWTNLKNVIFATGGTPAGFGPETVTVLRTSGGVFVANFENAHTGTWNITLDPAFQIATEGTTSIGATGVQIVTPRSMTNIVIGIRLKILQISGTGTTEVVTVTSTTSTTFTATFASTHSGTWSIQLDPTYTVNTTCSTPIGGGNEATCSPASLTNIFQGVKLLVGMGGNNQQALTSVKQGADLATFGERLLLINESRIADQPTLDIFAQGYLSLLDQVVIRTKVRVVDYRGDTQGGLGTDIETIQVGDTCKITDPFANTGTSPSASVWDTAVWDQSLWDYAPGASFNQVAAISALTYGFDYVDLEISTLQPNQDAAFMRLRNQLQALSLTQQ